MNDKPQIIAELGINHDGDFARLHQLTDLAFEHGADWVKLQIKTPELCVPTDQWDVIKETPWGEKLPYIEYKRRMEFPENLLEAFYSYVETNYEGRVFPSIWDVDAYKMAYRNLGFSMLKLPSAKITDMELVSHLVESWNITPMLSTGMSTMTEIENTVNLFLENNHRPIIMACTSTYPTEDNELNLNRIVTLKRRFPLCEIGFSSHSKSPFPAIYAMVLGATWVEVHFTDDRTRKGTDHSASLEPNGLSLIARERDRLMDAMGNGHISPYDSEKPYIAKLRG